MKIQKIWIDLDGVMANFDGGIKSLTGKLPTEITKKEMWKAIGRHESFFETLDLMPDALELWNFIHDHEHIKSGNIQTAILTGLPSMNDGAGQKRRWVAKTLSDTIEVIVCASKDKHKYATKGNVLIDDRQDMITGFNTAGGIGILHRSTIETIGQLKALGL